MSDGCTMEVIAGLHQPLVVKSATSEAGRATLAREADRLRRARHPGVVELLNATEDRLELAWAGTHTLDTCHPSLLDAAGILAAIASTVADLHGLGIIHGRLDPSHVVLGGDGRPRLCGLRGPGPSESDPSPAEDVAAIGRLMDHLVGPGAEPEPIPERRWGKRNWSGYHRRSLQTLADHATDEDPARRPTARAIAAAIVEAVPEARLVPVAAGAAVPLGVVVDQEADECLAAKKAIAPAEPTGEKDPDIADAPADHADPADLDLPDELRFLGLRIEAVDEPGSPEPLPSRRSLDPPLAPASSAPTRPRFSRSAAVITSGVVVVGLGVVGITLGRWGVPDQSPTRQIADTAISVKAPTPTKPERPCPTDPSPPPAIATALTADVDGDGCPDLVTVAGPSITAAGITYRVGVPGDHISLGDWDCDGIATPGIVRPSTGEVFLFDGWAPTGAPITSSAAAVFAGSTELIAPAAGTACAGPSVRLRGGRVVAVPAHRATSSEETGP